MRKRRGSLLGLAVAHLAVAGAIGIGGTGASRMAAKQPDIFGESASYEKFMGRWSRQLAPLLVQFAGVRAGDAVLDVGSGTGSLAAAVREAASSARVVGIDPSAAYVAYAGSQLPQDGFRFVVGDAQKMDFPDDSYDRALSLLVMNFIPDPAKALGEMTRVTRPGGTVAAAVWDYGGRMEMLRVFWDEAVAGDPAAEQRDERHMPLCRQGELAALWRNGGLAHVEEQPLTFPMSFASFDDYWAPFLGGQGPAGAYVATLPGDRRAALRERLLKRLADGDENRPFTLEARAWAARGEVPRK